MARYYTTDTFSTWNVFDPDFPDELPEVGERIYVAIIDGPLNKDSEKVFSEAYAFTYSGIDWLKAWLMALRDDPDYTPNVTVVWVPVPPAPKLPSKWRICGPTVCENNRCEHYDNGYCLDGPKDCKEGKIHKEFSRRDW